MTLRRIHRRRPDLVASASKKTKNWTCLRCGLLTANKGKVCTRCLGRYR